MSDYQPDPNNLYDQTSEALFPEWAKAFDEELDIVWNELIRLNSLVFVLQKVGSFPFHVFEPLDQDYWVMSFGSMFDTCVLMEYRIWYDMRKDVITLPKLQRQVEKELTSEDFRTQFITRLKSVPGVNRLTELEGRFKSARHKRIAHLSKDFLIGQSKSVSHNDEPLISDIVAAARTLSVYFHCLCFGHSRRMTLGDYGNDIRYPESADSRSDVEKLLDMVAKESALLNMPEKEPGLWPSYRVHNLSDSDLKIINQYRTKFGMPEVK